MRNLTALIGAKAAAWWEKHICAEDPDAREKRLMWEIENRAREKAALRAAFEVWAAENERATQEEHYRAA